MGQPFAENSYIDDQRDVRFGDGEKDEYERWVDAEGWVHLGPRDSGDVEDGRYVDIDGQLHEADGSAADVWFGLPSGWAVAVEGYRGAVDQVLDAQRNLQDADLSDTVGSSPDAQRLAEFRAGIRRTAGRDAVGGDLSFAGEDAPGSAADLGHRGLMPDYQGEDQFSDAFSAGMLRKTMQHDDQYTTIYDPAETDSVQQTSVNDKGLLLDAQGAPLTGKFGYVVDPNDGSLHVFDRSEAWVTNAGKWMSLAGIDAQAEMIKQAVANGEKVQSVHHSTPLAGQAVAGAGSLTVDQGVISEISDESGHYKPEGEYLWQTVEWLKAQGMDISQIDVKMIAKDRDPQLILKGWRAEQARGNQAQAVLKEGVLTDIRKRGTAAAERERVAALQAQAQQQETPAARHFKATGCNNYMPSGDGTYCEGCDNNL